MLPVRSTPFLSLLALSLGCSRQAPTPQPSTEPQRGIEAQRSHTAVEARASASVTAAAQAPTPLREPSVQSPPEAAERSFRFPSAERVVAIGDLHGDLASAREALRLAGAIDGQDKWIGGKMVLVQVGDQLDRGDDEPQILQLLERLALEAKQAGGVVHVLNGNHELMNAVGDLRYVTPDGMHDYANVSVPASAKFPPGFPADAKGRAAAFAPGSELARKLAERNTITIVGDTVFAHAGVLQKHVTYGVARINDEVRRFLRGELPNLPEVVGSDDAPVWTRVFGGPTSDEACHELEAVLSALSVKRLVVGHTVQPSGITNACDGRVYRVDVGLSDYYGNNPTQVLELTANGAKVLSSGANTNSAPKP